LQQQTDIAVVKMKQSICELKKKRKENAEVTSGQCQEATSGERQAGSDKREATSGKRQAGSDKREATSGKREATSGKRQAGSDKREATSGKRQAGAGSDQQ
jgi:hypothetical protein